MKVTARFIKQEEALKILPDLVRIIEIGDLIPRAMEEHMLRIQRR
jgi:hypothetical protein